MFHVIRPVVNVAASKSPAVNSPVVNSLEAKSGGALPNTEICKYFLMLFFSTEDLLRNIIYRANVLCKEPFSLYCNFFGKLRCKRVVAIISDEASVQR